MFIIRTTINDENKANIIADLLVVENIAASVHIRTIKNIIKNNDNIIHEDAFEIEGIVENPQDAFNKIKKINNQQIPEFIIYTALKTTQKFSDWVKQNCE